jgi:hypothetical protein
MIITGKYAASSVLLRQGIVIDLHNKTYKLVQKVLGLFKVKESWKPLPKADYILMFKTFYAKCEPCEMDETNPGTLQLSLVYNKNRRLLVHECNNVHEIRSLALTLSQILKLKIRDAITDRRSPKWIY